MKYHVQFKQQKGFLFWGLFPFILIISFSVEESYSMGFSSLFIIGHSLKKILGNYFLCQWIQDAIWERSGRWLPPWGPQWFTPTISPGFSPCCPASPGLSAPPPALGSPVPHGCSLPFPLAAFPSCLLTGSSPFLSVLFSVFCFLYSKVLFNQLFSVRQLQKISLLPCFWRWQTENASEGFFLVLESQ